MFLKYFWFSLIFIGAANALLIQRRAKPLIAKRPELQLHANRVSYTLVLMIGIPSALLGIIQWVAGYESPFYIFSDDLSNGYLLTAWIVMGGLRLFILWWLWCTTGVESYLAITPIRINKRLLRWAITTIIVGWFLVVLSNFY
jgi:hypothetical protein